MNATPELDDRIHDMLERVGSSAPTAPAFDDLRPGPLSQRSRLVPVAAAAALVAVGIGGVMLADGDGRDPIDRAPATQPEPAPTDASAVPLPLVEPATPDGVTGPLLTTEVDRAAVPLLELQGWEVTYAYSEVDLGLGGGFDDAVILVGPGPTYDAPLFAGSIVDEEQLGSMSPSELLEGGEPVQVGDETGSLSITDSGGVSNPSGSVSLLFVPLADGGMARINAVHIERDPLIEMAEHYLQSRNGDSNAMVRPDGWTEWETPDYPEHSTFSIRFVSPEGAEIEIVGENRGAASLLGRIAGEVRTTRTIGDTEVAWIEQEMPGQFWVDWRLGDWSFYAMAQGFDSEAQFTDTLQQIAVVNDVASGAGGGQLVTPVNRSETVDALLADVPLPPGFDVQPLRDLPGARDRYQEIARVSSAVTCGWLDVWFDAQESEDPAAGQPAVDALATATDWAMLIEIDSQGGWSSAVWETASAINGGPGVVNGEGVGVPSREGTEGGLGCTFD